MDFNGIEDMNGIRFSWNVLPTNRQDADSCHVPFGCVYTPLKQIIGRDEPLPYQPVLCRNCHSAMNPYSRVDFAAKTWLCPICGAVSPLPPGYHQMTEENLAAELHPSFTTVEYTLNVAPSYPPIFMFVVDTCVHQRELPHLQTALLRCIGNIPQNALVGFISFGNLTYIHELRFAECPRSYVFNGVKTYTPMQLQQYLGVSVCTKEINNPFIMPMKDAENMLTSIVDTLEIDPFPVPKGQRASRCTGAAIDIAVSLIEAIFPNSSTQMFLFTSGPITKGPGSVATLKITEPVRQHKEIDTGKALLYPGAKKYFTELAARATKNNIVVNYISASFEETGLKELYPLIFSTGGFLLSCETYSQENLAQTIKKYFEGDILSNAGSNALISMHLSKELRVSGCIGPCISNEKPTSSVSERRIGCGGTIQWKVSGILPSTSYAFYFDIFQNKTQPIQAESTGYVQIITQYKHITSGLSRMRVTTAPIHFSDLTTNQLSIENGFDQEAAAIILARMSMLRTESEEPIDVIHSLDRKLIGFSRKFATYTKGDINSFSLKRCFQFLPAFIYHLRRSPFLSTFNTTPDQTTSYRHSLLFENVTNSLFMIQPSLVRYSLDQQPEPVLLDINSLKSDSVFLLDTYFRVLIWHGSTIAAWAKEGYQEQPEYSNLKAVLESPLEESKLLLDERFPTPFFVSCNEDSSEARFLLVKCNPSTDPNIGISFDQKSSSDEQTLSKFIENLKKITVKEK